MTLLPQSSFARMTARDFVERFGTPLTEDRVYYRWQSTASGENLVRAGKMTEKLDAYFMSRDEDIVAGPGLYVANGELSSSSYLPHDGGNLVEVRVAKGTRVLDLTAPEVRAELIRNALSAKSFWNWSEGHDGLLVQYTQSWLVGKNMANQATFHMYPHESQSTDQILSTLASADQRTRPQLVRQVHERRPEILTTMTGRIGLTPEVVALTEDAKLPKLIASELKRPGAAMRAEQTLRVLAADPRSLDVITADPHLLEAAHATFRNSYGFTRTETPFNFLRDLALKLPDERQRTERLRQLLDAGLNDSGLRSIWTALARRVVPLLEAMKLDDVARARVLSSVRQALDRAGAESNVAPLREILAAAHVTDPALESVLTRLDAHGSLVRAARLSGRTEDLVKAFASTVTMDELHAAVGQIASAQLDHAIAAALGDLLRREPKRLGSMVSSTTDFEQAARLVGYAPRAGFDGTYDEILRADPAGRLAFYRVCALEPNCRPHLENRVAADHGAIFEGIKNLGRFADELPKDPHSVNLILSVLKEPEQLASFGRGVAYGSLRDVYGPIILARAQAIGLDRFSTRAVLDFGTFTRGDRNLQRRLMLRALSAARNPNDVIDVAGFASLHNLSSAALDADLRRTLVRYDARPDDYELARARRRTMGQPPKVAAPFDCINALARVLD